MATRSPLGRRDVSEASRSPREPSQTSARMQARRFEPAQQDLTSAQRVAEPVAAESGPRLHDFSRLPPPQATGPMPLQAKGAPADAPKNRTGMPDGLKSGLERLSGVDLSGVRVHRNSPEPSRVQALAYTQGRHIHVAPGQEQHLPHEGWHAVQQMQGRVKPTMRAHGVSINDDNGLEREADSMGKKALSSK